MRRAGFRRFLLPLLLVLCAIRLWLMPLASSFWLDETATIFVAQHGANHPSLAIAAPQAWHSWYYPVVRWQGRVLGYSEISVRLISVLAMAVFLWLFARLAARLVHPGSGWFAVFAGLALSGLDYQAANARPYALGICVFAAALLLLVGWLDSGRWLPGLLFAAAAAIVLYTHLLFWPSCLVFPLYAAARLLRKETPVSWRQAASVFGLWVILLLPVVSETLSLLRETRAHVIAPLPSLSQLLRSLQAPLVLGCAGGAWLIARCSRFRPEGWKPSAPAMVAIGAWWLCQPIVLFAFSWLTGDGVFVPRYLQLALPGAALAATAAAAPFLPWARGNRFALIVGLGALAFAGQWRTLWPRHHNSNWRAAAGAVNQIEADKATPV